MRKDLKTNKRRRNDDGHTEGAPFPPSMDNAFRAPFRYPLAGQNASHVQAEIHSGPPSVHEGLAAFSHPVQQNVPANHSRENQANPLRFEQMATFAATPPEMHHTENNTGYAASAYDGFGLSQDNGVVHLSAQDRRNNVNPANGSQQYNSNVSRHRHDATNVDASQEYTSSISTSFDTGKAESQNEIHAPQFASRSHGASSGAHNTDEHQIHEENHHGVSQGYVPKRRRDSVLSKTAEHKELRRSSEQTRRKQLNDAIAELACMLPPIEDVGATRATPKNKIETLQQAAKLILRLTERVEELRTEIEELKTAHAHHPQSLRNNLH